MSGLEALGIACNVMQLIELAAKLIAHCKDIYDGRHPHEDLLYRTTALSVLSQTLHDANENWHQANKAEKSLEEIVRKCNATARELDEEIRFISSHHRQKDFTAMLKIATKSVWRRRRLDRLARSLEENRRLLETHLLERLYSRIDTVRLQQSAGFTRLDKTLQNVLHQYSLGTSSLSDVIKQEAKAKIINVIQEIKRSEDTVISRNDSRVTQSEAEVKRHILEQTERIVKKTENIHTETITEQQRRDFLESFRFSGMNERMNHVTEAHVRTFEWIFGNDVDDSIDMSSLGGDGSSNLDKPSLNADANLDREESGIEESNADDIFSCFQLMDVKIDPYLSIPYIGEAHSVVSDSSNEDVSGGDGPGAVGDWDKSSHPLDDTGNAWNHYRDWLRSESSLYWISGKPGSGKSTLMKFICSNPVTKDALRAWNSDTVILSHFFWKPGNFLQRAVRGLYCNILYKILLRDTEMIRSVLHENEDFATRREVADWTSNELRNLCLTVLRIRSGSVLVFLDGLDEAIPGHISELLAFISEISCIDGIKVCVSSRPEPRLQAHLSRFQHCRLQDLTRRDIMLYTRHELESLRSDFNLSQEAINEAEEVLVQRAEGVFLWVGLAIKSFMRGLENKDSKDMLLSRLRLLPTELSDLYADMWSRFNDDEVLYRREAARMLKTILLYNRLYKNVAYLPIYEPRLNLFVFLGTIDDEVEADLMTGKLSTGRHRLAEKCSELLQLIRVRGAGLIDVSRAQASHTKFASSRPEQHENQQLIPYLKQCVGLIHRSAYDFLTETEMGIRIQSFDSLDGKALQLRIIHGMLSRHTLGLTPTPKTYSSLHTPYGYLDIFQAVLLMRRLGARGEEVGLERTLQLCLSRCEASRDMLVVRDLSRKGDHSGQSCSAALSLYKATENYVVETIMQASRPRALAMGILHAAEDHYTHCDSYPHIILCLQALAASSAWLNGDTRGTNPDQEDDYNLFALSDQNEMAVFVAKVATLLLLGPLLQSHLMGTKKLHNFRSTAVALVTRRTLRWYLPKELWRLGQQSVYRVKNDGFDLASVDGVVEIDGLVIQTTASHLVGTKWINSTGKGNASIRPSCYCNNGESTDCGHSCFIPSYTIQPHVQLVILVVEWRGKLNFYRVTSAPLAYKIAMQYFMQWTNPLRRVPPPTDGILEEIKLGTNIDLFEGYLFRFAEFPLR